MYNLGCLYADAGCECGTSCRSDLRSSGYSVADREQLEQPVNGGYTAQTLGAGGGENKVAHVGD